MSPWKETLNTRFPKSQLLSDSYEFLCQLKGKSIKKMVRLLSLSKTNAEMFSHDPKKYAKIISKSGRTRLQQLLIDLRIDENQVFEFGHGPLVLEVTANLSIAFYASRVVDSVVTWPDDVANLRSIIEGCSDQCVEIECEQSPFILSTFGELSGSIIQEIGFLKVVKSTSIPLERGLVFKTDRDQEIIIAYGLVKNRPSIFGVVDKNGLSDEFELRYTKLV